LELNLRWAYHLEVIRGGISLSDEKSTSYHDDDIEIFPINSFDWQKLQAFGGIHLSKN